MNAKKEGESLRQEMLQLHDEMVSLWRAEPLDRNAIFAKQAEIQAVKQELSQLMLRVRLDVFELLTDEQRTKARELLSQRRGKRGRGRGQGPGFGLGDCPMTD